MASNFFEFYFFQIYTNLYKLALEILLRKRRCKLLKNGTAEKEKDCNGTGKTK